MKTITKFSRFFTTESDTSPIKWCR